MFPLKLPTQTSQDSALKSEIIMPTFKVNTPDGGQVTVEAPEGSTPEQAIEFVASTWKAPEQQTQQAQPEQIPEPSVVDKIKNSAANILAPLPSHKLTDKEYWTENVPQSAARLPVAAAAGMGNMMYDAAKEFTDPVVNLLDSPMRVEDYLKAGVDLAHAPNRAVKGALSGMKEFVNAPLGLGEHQTASQAWDDPAASLLAISPLVKGGLKVGGKMVPSDVAVNLTRKALKFAPGVDPSLQKQVAKTILKEGALPTEAKYAEFKAGIKARNARVSEIIEPVADIPIEIKADSWVSPILKKLSLSAEKGKDLKAATKYLEDFKASHPNLTVAEAQEVKKSINFKLKTYWKQKSAGGIVKDAKADAMRAIGEGLRSEIEKHAPDTKGLNTEIHNMIVAQPFLKSATNKAASAPFVATRDWIAGGAAGGLISPGAAVPAMLASKLIRDPRVQGGVGKAIYSVGEFAGKIKGMLRHTEAAKIVSEIEARMPEQLQIPNDRQNQLAIGWNGKAIELGEGPKAPPAAAIHLGGPKEMVPAEVNAFERLFQIAQSPEGKRLLIERLGREEKHAKLVAELMKVPTTKALPPGQGFMLRGQKITENELAREMQ